MLSREFLQQLEAQRNAKATVAAALVREKAEQEAAEEARRVSLTKKVDALWDQINPAGVLKKIKEACGQGVLELIIEEALKRRVVLVNLPLPDLPLTIPRDWQYRQRLPDRTKMEIRICFLTTYLTAKDKTSSKDDEPSVIVTGGCQSNEHLLHYKRMAGTYNPQEESGSGHYFYKELSPGDPNFPDEFDNAVQEAWKNRAWRTPYIPPSPPSPPV